MIKKLIRVITIFALAFALLALLTNSMRRVQNQPCSICFDPDYAFAVTCFYKGEQVSGFNKICYYDCLGSMAAITISSVALCPLTIQH